MTAITLLDGSIGQELVRRAGATPTPLWSTQVMMDRPALAGEVHQDYFARGATIATANTYAMHLSRLERVGLVDRLSDLVDAALGQAEAAKQRYPGTRIAGALGPLLASYRPDLMPDVQDAEEKFSSLVSLMDDRVDLFLIETVSSLQEAEGALMGTMKATKPVWIAFSVQDENGTFLRSGEPLADAGPLIDRFSPAAVLINCSRPEAMPAALEAVRRFGRPFGAYANGFTGITDGFLQEFPTVDALEARADLAPDDYADLVMGWVAQGATIVGGCCEVGPDHIEAIATRLRAAGHTIV